MITGPTTLDEFIDDYIKSFFADLEETMQINDFEYPDNMKDALWDSGCVMQPVKVSIAA